VLDGHADDWDSQDVVAVGLVEARGGAALELTALLADDNATHRFFAVNYTALRAAGNDTLALYFFAGESATAPEEPRGLALTLPSGAALVYALYLDLSEPLPGGSELMFFDGSSWRNRTLADFRIVAARNDTSGVLEVSAPRDTFIFPAGGGLATVVFDPNGTALDGVPDLVGQPPALGRTAPVFDYSAHPPIEFTAIGFSDPGAAEGQPVLLFLQLSNTGPKTATGVSAHVLVDGEPLGAREGITLLPGGTAVLNFTWTARAGLHTFTATSFPGGTQRTITAAFSGPAAVLTIEDVRIEPSTVYIGQDFHVLVTVRNLGAAPSGAADLLLKDATRIVSRGSVPSLPPGESANASMRAYYELPGTRTLRVEINGVHTPGALREVEVEVQEPGLPFGLPLEAIALLVVGATGAGVWLLTPRLLAERPPREP
jgi:hypothetical protein